MSDLLRPEKGARPWLPAVDATPVIELDRYNVPLGGIVRQDGVDYLYACLLGEVERENLWVYARLEPDEFVSLTSLTGDDLDDAIHRALTQRTLTLAVAMNWQLVDWDHLEVGDDDALTIARRFLAQWSEELYQQERAQQELAQRQDLVSC